MLVPILCLRILFLSAVLIAAPVSFDQKTDPPPIPPTTAPVSPPLSELSQEPTFEQYVNIPVVFGAPVAEKYPPDNRAYELEVLRLVNVERAANGLPALIEDSALTQAARRYAEDMASNTLRGHIGSDGTTPGDRMQQEGYSGLPWSEASAFNQPSPSAVVGAWLTSPSHRAILLDANVNEVGLGYALNESGTYRETWVVDTGRNQ